MEKLKSKKGNLKRMFHTSGTKHGSYSVEPSGAGRSSCGLEAPTESR